MTQPTTSPLERTRAFLADAVSDSADAQVAISLLEFLVTAKRLVPGQRDQATVNAMLSKLAIEGPMRSSAISQYLMLDPSTVSRHICAMADDQLVTRTPDEHDRRAQWVTISPLGQQHLQARMLERISQLKHVIRDWPLGDKAEFGRLLARFVTDFDRTITEAEQA
ncbi:MAG: MarR family transcriptional regulator [Candidatus Nanopelagicales bacterium]